MADELSNEFDRFAQIPLPLLEAPTTVVSNTAKVLFAILWSYTVEGDRSAFPGRKALATRLGASVDTVDRCVRQLVKFGCLVVEARQDDVGDQTSNLYRLVPVRGSRTDAATPPQKRGHGGRTDAARVAAPVRPKEEPQEEEPQEEHTPPHGVVAVVDPVELDFERIWKAWPRKDGSKKAALTKFRTALKKTPVRTIGEAALAHAARYAQWSPADRQQFAPHLATWLYQERWLSELPPERGTTNTPKETAFERNLRLSREEYENDHGVSPDRPSTDRSIGG